MSMKRTQALAAARVAESYQRAAAPVAATSYDLAPWTAPSELDVDQLRFLCEQQPRDMLTDREWDGLMLEGRNDPAGVLAALQVAAQAGGPSKEVLEHVAELTASIRSEGVLVQLSVLRRGDKYVVLDGHCRAMAAVIAGRPTVPVRLEISAAEGDLEAELTTVSHRFILNSTQQRLAPLEAMQEVVRIATLAERVVRARLFDDLQPIPNDLAPTLTSDESTDGESQTGVAPDGSDGPVAGRTRAAQVGTAVRRLVLGKTGLSLDRYHTLYRLRTLHPEAMAEARAAGRLLTEDHLRAIVGAPTGLQPLLVKLVVLANASVKETRAYCKAASQEGEEYLVARYAEALKRREGSARRRTAVSWEPLLRAIPDDLTPRISALRAELQALERTRRDVRLRALLRQYHLLQEAARAFQDILTLYEVPLGSDLPRVEISTEV